MNRICSLLFALVTGRGRRPVDKLVSDFVTLR
jgi:hypothetical protein